MSKLASQVVVFQRTPAWVIAKNNLDIKGQHTHIYIYTFTSMDVYIHTYTQPGHGQPGRHIYVNGVRHP